MNKFRFDIQRFDDINNTVDGASVVGTAGNDVITNTGNNVTINALGGADSINVNYSSAFAYIQYAKGDGNDTITGYTSEDNSFTYQLSISGSAYTSAASGANVIIGVGTDSITIQDGISDAGVKGIDINGSYRDSLGNIPNSNDEVNVYGTDAADSINNKGQFVTIQSYGGNDTIINESGAETVNNVINAGAGNDTVLANGQAITVNGGAGNDSITVQKYGHVTVDAGDDADVIFLEDVFIDGSVEQANSSIFGGAGADTITGSGNYITVNGGADNDTIEISGSNNVYVYNSGDGADVINDFRANDTLVIGDGTGTYSTTTSGNDVVVTVGDGNITLNGAAGLSALNIQGTYSGDTTTGGTVQGGTWTGTADDDTQDTAAYDIETQRTTIYSALNGMGGNDKLTNYPAFANVTIDGGEGNDQIYNRGAYGSLIGGEGNDYIENKGVDNAKVNNSTIDGGAGADVVDNLGDNVLISGGADDDSVYSSGEKATITGGAGNDTLYSYGSYSSIDGGADDDNLTASGSNVTVQGGAGNDTLNFSGGSDSIAANGIVEDTVGNNYFHSEYITTSTITGGTGDDSVYSSNTENVAIILGAGANTLTSNYDKNLAITAGAGNDNVTLYDASSVNADLGNGANRLTVTNLNDSTASGYTITSGTGADTINVDANNAIINAGDGANFITIGGYEGGNNVTLNTGSGADYIYNYYNSVYGSGRQENVVINSGAGNDTVINNGDKATINGGDGNDEIQSYNGTDYIINGDAGADTIFGANGTLNGGEGADSISGNNATISGGAGNDTIRAGENVLVQYASGDGDDFIEEFNSSTTLSISDGTGTYSTTVSGDNVIVTVGDGKITLGNAASLETLNIVGGEAVENWATVTTGTISTAIDKSATVASGTTGDDTIKTEQISGDTTARLIEGNGGNDSILNFVSNVTISGGADKDSVVSSADNVVIQTGGGNDYIQGATKGNVNITIDAGEGNDEIDTYGTSASINGGAGNDSIKISADSEKVTVLAGEGSDTVVNTATDSFIDGGAGADSIHNDSGNVTIDAGADDDVITSYGDKVSISGGAGADKITVTNSYDGVGTISGGIGDDTVSIGSGNFLLEYTSGDGADVVQGFKANDTLSIDGTFTSVTSGDDVVLTVGDGNITLGNAASLGTLNIVGDNSNSEAESFVTLLQQRTLAGYPVIAGMFFHPEEYHGFDTLPSSYYVESETLTINSSDGFELTGFHYTPENPNDKWVILVHGYGHNHRHMNGFAQQYLTNNYHVLMVDQRAAGDSEGEWLTMSAGESKDLVLWTHKVAELNPNAKITLHGVSMGAATAMLAAANSGLTNVTSLVEDCGYTSVLKLVDIVKSAYPALGDPAFVDLVDKTSGSLTGYTLSEASPIDSISSATVPSMFITGTSDVVVSMSMLESLYAASGAEVKEIFTVEGATHGLSALTDSIGYANTVFRFNAEAAGEGWVTSNVTDNISLRGTKYADTITSSGKNVTINTGVGDDTINNSGSAVIQYNSGDGADVINGFTASDTLIIGASYATQTSGDDVVVTVIDGSITLNDAASLSALNIVGTGSINNTVDNTLVAGTPYYDLIYNTGSNVTINALAGDDTISNIDNNKTLIDAGDGDDLVFNTFSYGIVTLASGEETLVNPYSDTTIVAGAGNDIVNLVGGNKVSVSAGEGDDNIFSFHSYYKTVDGGAGNDFINISEGHHENIYGGDGNDSIIGTILFETLKGDWAMGGYAQIDGGAGADYVSVGYSNNSTISGGDGADTIITYGPNSKVFGGDGNDSISLISNSETTLTSAGTTITGGAGDDTITGDGSGVIYNYTSGDGNDVINGITANDVLLIDGVEFSTVASGNDVVVTAGENNITLTDAATVSGLKIRSALAVDNTVNNTLVAGTPADDLIYNTGSNVTIQGLAGNDTINNFDNNQTFIDSGDGDDLVINRLTYEVATVNGKEVLHNYYSDTSITAGAGNDSVFVQGGYNVSITTGEGIDSIHSKHSYNQTIDAGAGDDFIGISEGHNEYISSGDGADTIVGETITGKWEMGGNATIDGGAGDDYFYIGYSNNASITGGDGADTILTYGTNSEVDGGAGNDVITLITDTTNTGLNSAGTTITGGAGDDTITSDGSGVVVKYSAGDGNDVITGLSASDTVLIDSAYKASVSGNDLIVTVSSSQETLTLKNAANTKPNLSVAVIAQGDSTYAYSSIAEAATNADAGSTVTVIADSTETATIPSDKNLTMQFAASDTGVYNVTGGNFVSASDFAGFSADSLVSGGGNTLSIANGSTATFNGYEITGNANGYTFALQSNVAPINGIEFNGAGTASFDTDGNISLTSGAVATMAESDAATFNLGAGSYTINGNAVSANADKQITFDSDTAQFVVTSDSISYNAFTFSGSGAASVANDLPTLTAGVEVNRDGRDMVVLTEKGQNTINGRGFWMTEALPEGITVGAVDNGIGAAYIVSDKDFPEDAGKLFAEEALIYGDDSYTVRLTYEGIKSIYGISAGSTVRGTAYLDGEVDTLGSILQLAVDSPGVYNLANKAYTLSGAIDSENVVALSSRFYTDNTSALRRVYYLNGTISGDFSSAVTINNAPMDVQVLGDSVVSVYATDSVKPMADLNSSVISSSGNATSITGVGNGASVVSAGGATLVSTNEEGVFTFRSDADTQQGFTVTGDDSVDFILQNYTDENGNATMQVAGVNNFENGFYTISKDSAYHAINAGENIAAGDELVIGFADTATFVIADSKVVSVNGVDYSINRLKGDVAVHAANAVTVNGVYADVAGDDNFDVIVADSKVASLVNISAGASVSVESVDIVTDNSGEFKIGNYVYNLDVDGGVTFTTDSNGAVKNISGVTGMLNTSANNITLNGAKFTTTNTDVTITAADSEINWVEGLASGDSIGGDLDSTTVSIPANQDSDTVEVTINSRGYTLNDDSTGIHITNDFISGLDSGARLQISAAGTYNVNGTTLRTKVGDTIVGTAEGSAYIFDPNNIPLNTNTMSNDEISAQVGIPASYSSVIEDTNIAGSTVANGGASTLNGTMALALDNTGSNIAQTADFSNSTGRKRITLEGGDQAVKFNNEGRNVAVIEGGATGEKNVSLGGGGDLAIVRDTSTPVNVTTGAGKDTVVTAGGDVFVEMGSGAAKIVPNSGNVALNNYNAATGAGIQLNEFADLTRAIMSGNIALEIGAITFNDVHVRFGADDETSSIVNLFNNEGKKQKVAYTNGDGGVADLSGEREAVMFVGNTGGNTSLTGGSGNDTAIGGAGDYIDLGAGNNYIALSDNAGAVIGFTAREGKTEVDGFTGGFGEHTDRVSLDISIGQVKFDGVNMTFTNGGGTMILKNIGGAADLAESADLMVDDNFIADNNVISGTTLDEITPITYEQGDYQNLYDATDATFAKAQDTISAVTFAKG